MNLLIAFLLLPKAPTAAPPFPSNPASISSSLTDHLPHWHQGGPHSSVPAAVAAACRQECLTGAFLSFESLIRYDPTQWAFDRVGHLSAKSLLVSRRRGCMCLGTLRTRIGYAQCTVHE